MQTNYGESADFPAGWTAVGTTMVRGAIELLKQLCELMPEQADRDEQFIRHVHGVLSILLTVDASTPVSTEDVATLKRTIARFRDRHRATYFVLATALQRVESRAGNFAREGLTRSSSKPDYGWLRRKHRHEALARMTRRLGVEKLSRCAATIPAVCHGPLMRDWERCLAGALAEVLAPPLTLHMDPAEAAYAATAIYDIMNAPAALWSRHTADLLTVLGRVQAVLLDPVIDPAAAAYSN